MKRYCFCLTNFSQSSTFTAARGRYGTGHSGHVRERSLRKMTNPVRSVSDLPSTYSVGRLQVSTMPLRSGFAVRFLISCGIANSGARGSPFLPQPIHSTTIILPRAKKVFIQALSLLGDAPHSFEPCLPVLDVGQPPLRQKDSGIYLFQFF